MVATSEQAGVVPHLGSLEAARWRHHYLGPEHLLLGLLNQGDDPIRTVTTPRAACCAGTAWTLRPCGPGSTG
ncbi:MAG TPA: Clp protease N-terminal domain-containing protein [Actinomycetota bacterium]|jgi:hypothetical protein